MAFGLKRTDLQAFAQGKIDDALILLDNERWSNAYYLAGYGVEIGLKACIARLMMADVIPDKKFIDAIYSHNIKELAAQAGLAADLRNIIDTDAEFSANWALCARWSPTARYDSFTRSSAQTLLHAIIEPNHGVFQWIKQNW